MSNNITIAFDFGTRNIGVAVGQCITNTANPLGAIKAKNGIPNWILVEKLLKEWKPRNIVVGLPLNMNGTEQPITLYAYTFANRIRDLYGIAIEMHDERLSTVTARDWLFEKKGFYSLNKNNIDSISAVIILESYFYKINSY